MITLKVTRATRNFSKEIGKNRKDGNKSMSEYFVSLLSRKSERENGWVSVEGI